MRALHYSSRLDECRDCSQEESKQGRDTFTCSAASWCSRRACRRGTGLGTNGGGAHPAIGGHGEARSVRHIGAVRHAILVIHDVATPARDAVLAAREVRQVREGGTRLLVALEGPSAGRKRDGDHGEPKKEGGKGTLRQLHGLRF